MFRKLVAEWSLDWHDQYQMPLYVSAFQHEKLNINDQILIRLKWKCSVYKVKDITSYLFDPQRLIYIYTSEN